MITEFYLIGLACEEAAKPLREKELQRLVEATFPEVHHISDASTPEEREIAVQHLRQSLSLPNRPDTFV